MKLSELKKKLEEGAQNALNTIFASQKIISPVPERKMVEVPKNTSFWQESNPIAKALLSSQKTIQNIPSALEKTPILGAMYQQTRPIRDYLLQRNGYDRLNLKETGELAKSVGATAFNIAGAQALAKQGLAGAAKTLGGSALVGGGLNAAIQRTRLGDPNKTVPQAFMEGAGQGLKVAPLAALTNPVTGAVGRQIGGRIGRLVSKNSVVQQALAQAAGRGITNVGEGAIITNQLGQQYSPLQAAGDFAIGAILPGKTVAGLTKGGLKRKPNPQDVADLDKAVDVLRSNKASLQQKEYAKNTVLTLAEGYLPQNNKYRDNVNINGIIRTLQKNWRNSDAEDYSYPYYKSQFVNIDKESGIVFSQFKNKPKEAINFLIKNGEGEVNGAITKEGLGPIDFIYGKGGSNGYGIAHIQEKHPEVLDKIPTMIQNGVIAKSAIPGRTYIVSKDGKSVIRLDWDNKKRNWLLTAFENKKNLTSQGNNTFTGKTTATTSTLRDVMGNNIIQRFTTKIPQNIEAKSLKSPEIAAIKEGKLPTDPYSLANSRSLEETIPTNKKIGHSPPNQVNLETPSGTNSLNKVSLENAQLKGEPQQLLPYKNYNKMRGFPETVTENPATPPQVTKNIKDNPANYYNPLSNKNVTEYVDKAILSKGEDFALNYAKTKDDTYANATAMKMISKYLDSGEFEKANDLIAAVSPRFTKQGQQIQILSLFNRLRPEGALKYAQRVLDKFNENLPPKKQLKLDPKQAERIAKAAKDLENIPDGTREKIEKTALLMKEIQDVVPAGFWKKVGTVQTIMQLLNPKTVIRNLVGTTAFTGLDNVSQIIATPLDIAVSLFTKQRSVNLPTLSGQLKGAVKGFKEGVRDVKLGIDTSGLEFGGKYDLPKTVFKRGLGGQMEKLLNFVLRVPDRANFEAARQDTLQGLKRVNPNLTDEQLNEIATAQGLYRTFSDNSTLAQMAQGAKDLLNRAGFGTPDGRFGIGDLIIKYAKTPANILDRAFDYSPIAIIKIIRNIARYANDPSVLNQRNAVMSLSRALVGTGIVGIGYELGKLGILTAQKDKDYDLNNANAATGRGPFRINVSALNRLLSGESTAERPGDTLLSYDWFQPNSIMLAMGANAARAGEDADYTDTINNALQTLVDQPMVTGVSSFVDGLTDPNGGGWAKAGRNVLSGLPASFTPSLLNQVGQLTDNVSRETYSPNLTTEMLNRVYARIPGLRNTLPARSDTLGNEREVYQSGSNNLFNVFLNPAFVSQVKDDPVYSEVLRLYKATNEKGQLPRTPDKKVEINGEKKQLNTEEFNRYQKALGSLTRETFTALTNDPMYQQLSDTDKVKVLQNALTDINTAIKVKELGDRPKKANTNTKLLLKNDISGMSENRLKTLIKEIEKQAGKEVDDLTQMDLEQYIRYLNTRKRGRRKGFGRVKVGKARKTKIKLKTSVPKMKKIVVKVKKNTKKITKYKPVKIRIKRKNPLKKIRVVA